jgi:hypothetical protein
MSGAATQTSPRKSPAKTGGSTTLPPKQTVASTPAAEKGGQPTALYVDVGVDTVAKNKTCLGRGKRKTPPESSEEPVKTPRTVSRATVLLLMHRVTLYHANSVRTTTVH